VSPRDDPRTLGSRPQDVVKPMTRPGLSGRTPDDADLSIRRSERVILADGDNLMPSLLRWHSQFFYWLANMEHWNFHLSIVAGCLSGRRPSARRPGDGNRSGGTREPDPSRRSMSCDSEGAGRTEKGRANITDGRGVLLAGRTPRIGYSPSRRGFAAATPRQRWNEEIIIKSRRTKPCATATSRAASSRGRCDARLRVRGWLSSTSKHIDIEKTHPATTLATPAPSVLTTSFEARFDLA
jgi:hypothetical protein